MPKLTPRRVIVTGSRTWTERGAVWGALDGFLALDRLLTVVHGNCPDGADALAAAWVVHTFRYSHKGYVGAEPHAADWQAHGKRAGFIRNTEMVKAGAGLCLAFIMPCTQAGCRRSEPHGSHGATGCADLAEAAGIETRRITPDA